MTPPNPFRVHVTDQILAALADSPVPLPTPEIEQRTGYGRRHGQLVYQLLTRLAAAGEVEKIGVRGMKPVYWRRLTPVTSLPPMVILPGPEESR